MSLGQHHLADELLRNEELFVMDAVYRRVLGPAHSDMDPSIEKYILIGIGNNQTSIWRSTFNGDGKWNNDWTKIPGASPSPLAVAGGGYTATY